MNKVLLLAAAAVFVAPLAPLAPAAAAVPPLAYKARTLPNGLKVYSLRDPKSANVSIQVWYDVGSRDDPRGRSGFAHLFEHLMFKQTENLAPEQFDRLTEDVGGFNNASTDSDYTNYYEVVPANHLERILWAEADRMRSLVIDPTFFASERDVVKEEFRSRVLAAPYGRLFYLYLPQVSYDVDPYARPGIGSIEDLDAATVEDVRAFHATYYRPDNAVLLVSGNFDQAQLDRWVDRYFKPIARPSLKIPRVTVTEPARAKARAFTVYEPNTPLPAVALSYAIPPRRDRDSVALEVLDAILSRGDSSRLHDALVYREQVAAETFTFLDQRKGKGMFAVAAILAGGKDAAAGETSLRREIARLRDGPVTAGELAEAKSELLTAALRNRESVDGRASELAAAVLINGSALDADRRLAAIQAITAADIQRVARTYLRDETSAAVRYFPEEMQKGAAEDRIATLGSVRTARLVPPANIKVWTAASDSDRVAPPPPAPELTTAIPKPSVQALGNGLNVITVTDRKLPLVTATLVAAGGAATDPAGRGGAAQLTAAVMTEGTATRSATEVDREIEALGSSIGSSAGWDGAQLSTTVETRHLDPALDLLGDLARNATLPAAEIERQRSSAIDGVAVSMSNPGDVAGKAVAAALFGAAPYGHAASGTVNSLKAIQRADLERLYRQTWRPANVTLVLTGDIDAASARAMAQKHFGSWASTAPAAPVVASDAPAPLRGKVVVIDMAGSGQAAVAVARPGIARADPRYYPAMVANAVLGGGYSARLNQEIRIKRGLSYGSRSSFDARRSVGPFSAITQTRNDAADQVLALTLGEMAKLGTSAVAADELAARRSALTGGFGRSIESTAGVAGMIADYLQRGVPATTLGTYLPSVLAVSPGQVQQVAGELLGSDGSTVVVVGDSKLFVDKLRKAYPELLVIPLKDLNLDSPTLR